MRYRDTIPVPAIKPSVVSGRLYESFAESATPTLSFNSVAEAAVAAYVVMAVEGRGNDFAWSIASKLKKVTDPELLASGETVHLAPVTEERAVLVRRVIGEVATGWTSLGQAAANQNWQIPPAVVKAAQHMHYGPQAHQVGTAAPVHYAWVPQEFDGSTAYEDMAAAVTAIAKQGVLPVKPPEEGQASHDWDKYLLALSQQQVAEQLVAV